MWFNSRSGSGISLYCAKYIEVLSDVGRNHSNFLPWIIIHELLKDIQLGDFLCKIASKEVMFESMWTKWIIVDIKNLQYFLVKFIKSRPFYFEFITTMQNKEDSLQFLEEFNMIKLNPPFAHGTAFEIYYTSKSPGRYMIKRIYLTAGLLERT